MHKQIGILKHNGTIKVFPVQGRTRRAAVSLVQKHTNPGSLYCTDEWQAYASLRVREERIVIRKERECPKDRNHINWIEGFWSYAKHWLYPYRKVPKKFFYLYLGKIRCLFNHKREDISPYIIKTAQSH